MPDERLSPANQKGWNGKMRAAAAPVSSPPTSRGRGVWSPGETSMLLLLLLLMLLLLLLPPLLLGLLSASPALGVGAMTPSTSRDSMAAPMPRPGRM